MNASAKIERLEALLGRIQRNAAALSTRRSAAELTLVEAAAAVPLPSSQIDSALPAPLELESAQPAPMLGGSVQPAALDVESIPARSAADVSAPANEFRESVPAPSDAEIPSDIELELTEELSPISDELAFTDPPPHSSEQPKSLEGLGASLGFHPPGQDGIPSSIGEAVERAATDDQARTPPPESGPQATIPPKSEEFDPELDEADTLLSTAEGEGPTVSQLGTTVELEPAASSEALELVPAAAGEEEEPDEFEAKLPEPEFGGGYDESLAPPPNAREELQGYDRAERERQARRSYPPQQYSVPPRPKPTSDGATADETVSRPAVDIAAAPVLYEGERPRVATLTFVQRLDAALRLGS